MIPHNTIFTLAVLLSYISLIVCDNTFIMKINSTRSALTKRVGHKNGKLLINLNVISRRLRIINVIIYYCYYTKVLQSLPTLNLNDTGVVKGYSIFIYFAAF